MYNTMSSANKDSFTSSIPSSYLIAMAGTSNTMLNKKTESRYPCLVPNVKGNTCGFCPLNMMLAVGVSYLAFIMFRYVPSVLTLLRVFFFIINGCFILSNAFSTSIDVIM